MVPESRSGGEPLTLTIYGTLNYNSNYSDESSVRFSMLSNLSNKSKTSGIYCNRSIMIYYFMSTVYAIRVVLLPIHHLCTSEFIVADLQPMGEDSALS